MKQPADKLRQDQTRQSETVFEGRAFKVHVDTITKGDGSLTTREIVDHPAAVAIVAVDADMNCLLEYQYRHATGKVLLEIPAGSIEPGESADECVCRELREETGYLPHRIKRIGGFYSAPGFCTEFLHLYLASQLEHSPLTASDTDEIKLVRVPIANIPVLVSSGEIQDAKSIAGLLTVLAFHRSEVGLSANGPKPATTKSPEEAVQ